MKQTYCFNYAEGEPKEVLTWKYNSHAFESQEELLSFVETLRPFLQDKRGVHGWTIKFMGRCHLLGRCERLSEGGLMLERYLIKFYGNNILLSTVLHEFAHAADRSQHHHGKEFTGEMLTLMKLAEETLVEGMEGVSNG